VKDTELSPDQEVRLQLALAYIQAAGGDFVQPKPMSVYVLAMTRTVMEGIIAPDTND